MTLVEIFKTRIEQYWDHLRQHDLYSRALLNGTATQEMVTHFLINIRYLVQHTPIHLNRAIEAAHRSGNEKLAEYFRQKLKEEQGHDEWADSDLAVLNSKKNFTDILSLNIDASMLVYVKHLEHLIDTDPHLYLGYIFFPEYLCVVAGPQMAEGIENKCGFPKDSITVISKHAELDKAHVDDWVYVIHDLIDEKRYKKALLESLEMIISLHEKFLETCREKSSHEAA